MSMPSGPAASTGRKLVLPTPMHSAQPCVVRVPIGMPREERRFGTSSSLLYVVFVRPWQAPTLASMRTMVLLILAAMSATLGKRHGLRCRRTRAIPMLTAACSLASRNYA